MIDAEWIETEVIEYTKLLVRNQQFAEDIQNQIGQKVDVSGIDGIYDDDKNAERKRRDMNNRLNKIYEEIYNVEDMITDCEKRRVASEQNTLTKDNVYKMLLVFDKLFDKMNDTDKRKLLESLISEVRLHPKETWAEGKNPIKEIKYA